MNKFIEKILVPIAILLLILAIVPLISSFRSDTYSKPAPEKRSAPARIAYTPPPAAAPAPAYHSPSSGVIENAFRARTTKINVVETGTVTRLLPDDNDGSRHQRFIVTLSSGHTVLIAHNIDLAPRVNTLREGDSITFAGVFEWNEKGGVVHWTHHDPGGRKTGGYLQHHGQVYR